jgi:hypothetical protein
MSSTQGVATVELNSVAVTMEENLQQVVFDHSPSIEHQHPADDIPDTQTWLHRSRILKLCSIANVVLILLLAAMSAIVSEVYSSISSRLAIWTAQKDYLEYCEAVGCLDIVFQIFV